MTLVPSIPRTAGNRVIEARRTKNTASMMPIAIVRTAGAGTSRTAERLTSTVIPDRTTALPAVSMVSATAARGDDA